jgi:hypothetical protein
VWSIVTSDLNTQPAEVEEFSPDGVRFRIPISGPSAGVGSGLGSGLEHRVPMSDFVSMHRQPQAMHLKSNFMMLLPHGLRLAGEPVGSIDDTLTWKSPALGEIPVPFADLRLISADPDASAPAQPPKQDVVTISNGDTVAGVFLGIDHGTVSVQTSSEVSSVPIDKISSIAFSQSTPETNTIRRPAYRLHLTDGSIVMVAGAVLQGDDLKITLIGDGAKSIAIRFATVLEIEQVDGPLSWLSEHPPTENVQAAYFGGGNEWPARFDLSVDGSPLVFNGRLYGHGIGVHAYSKLSFKVDPGWTAFRTQYVTHSRTDAPACCSDVTVRIKIDSKVVYEQTHVHASALSPVLTFNLNGGELLTLECDYGAAADVQAHLDWLQPALIRSLPPHEVVGDSKAPLH